MYNARKVKCADCGDIFKIEYDSRKDKQDVYRCKCGKLKCYPNLYGFSYDRDGNYEEMDFKDEDYTCLYYEEDFIKLSDEANLLLSEIDDLGKQLNEQVGIYYSNCTDREYISLELDGGSKKEGIAIKANVKLYDDNGWKYHREKQEKRVIEALTRFKDILNQVNSKDLDLSKPKKIWDDNNLEWNDGAKTQQDLYDYELYC